MVHWLQNLVITIIQYLAFHLEMVPGLTCCNLALQMTQALTRSVKHGLFGADNN